MADKHGPYGKDPKRAGQPNRWFGADTCECVCGCSMIAVRGLCWTCESPAEKRRIKAAR